MTPWRAASLEFHLKNVSCEPSSRGLNLYLGAGYDDLNSQTQDYSKYGGASQSQSKGSAGGAVSSSATEIAGSTYGKTHTQVHFHLQLPSPFCDPKMNIPQLLQSSIIAFNNRGIVLFLSSPLTRQASMQQRLPPSTSPCLQGLKRARWLQQLPMGAHTSL